MSVTLAVRLKVSCSMRENRNRATTCIYWFIYNRTKDEVRKIVKRREQVIV